ncbi:MAG: LptE family protein [Candidatus Omnitrophica bacterium]|nr:LptE family protein [Candidatus Omnitrophota bacterium]
MKKLILLSCLFLTGLMIAGCGYTTGSVISSRFKTIYVEPFENKIDYMNAVQRNVYIPQMETKVHSTVVDRFMFDGNLKVVEKGNSDLVLKGQLVGYDRDELRLTSNEDVKEYRITIRMALKLWDPVSEKVVWEEPSFAGDTTFFTTGPLAKSEDAAIQDALTDLARRIVARTIEDW